MVLNALLIFRYDMVLLIHKSGCIGEVHYPAWMFISFTCPAGCFKYPSGVYSSYSIYSSPVLIKSWRIQRRRIRESQTSMKCHGILYNGPHKLFLGLSLWNANETLIVIFRGKGNVWMVLKCSVAFQRRDSFEKLKQKTRGGNGKPPLSRNPFKC